MMTKEEIIELAGHRQVPAWVMKLVGDAIAKERESILLNTMKALDVDGHCDIVLCADIRARGQE